MSARWFLRLIVAAFMAQCFGSTASAQCNDVLGEPLTYETELVIPRYQSGNYAQALDNSDWLIQEWRGFLNHRGPCEREVRASYERALGWKYLSLFGIKRFNDAVSVLRELATTCQACAQDDRAVYYSNLGYALYQSERFAEALDACRAAMAITPDSTIATFGAAETLIMLMRPEEALHYLRRVVQMAGSTQGDQLDVKLARDAIAHLEAAIDKPQQPTGTGNPFARFAVKPMGAAPNRGATLSTPTIRPSVTPSACETQNCTVKVTITGVIAGDTLDKVRAGLSRIGPGGVYIELDSPGGKC
jgi:tetratricopeptide (TPR) repeat protein